MHMAGRASGLLALLFLSCMVVGGTAEYIPEDSLGDRSDNVVRTITRKLQEINIVTSSPAGTTSVGTAAANIGPPSLDGMRSGMQNFFGKVGEWFAEVGQLRPRLPSWPQRAQRLVPERGTPSGGSSSSGSGRGSSSGSDRDSESSHSGGDESSSRRSSASVGRDSGSTRDRDSSRRDNSRDEVLHFQPPDIMESGRRVSRREEARSRDSHRDSHRDSRRSRHD